MLPLHLLISPVNAPKYPMPQRHKQYGFSLLELVVVMGILAIFASVSLTFVGEKDVQQRYNESLEKLTMVKRNFFSVDKFQGQMVMHGFFIDNGMLRESTLKAAVSTSFRTILNSRTEPKDTTNVPQLKTEYKPFSFISEIHINYTDPDPNDAFDSSVSNEILIGAGLYKGIRPGAFDLSQYQDANNEIRDAWGDEFEFNTELNVNVIRMKEKGYKNLGSSKSEVDISYSDLVFDSSTLKINLKKVTESNELRFAIVSFNNSSTCITVPEACWSTILSLILPPATTSPTTFSLSETTPPTDIVRFDNTTDLIKSISPDMSTGSVEEKITDLVFTDIDDKEWSLTAQPITTQPFTASADFTGNLTVGSHVLVLLEKSDNGWVLYESSGNHIFEYLHIFPGLTPDPITMSIP